MLYKLLFCVGSIIILFFLSVSYFKSLNKISKITFRQKVYKLLIILAFTSIFFDIFELFFYYKGPKIIYQISYNLQDKKLYTKKYIICNVKLYYFQFTLHEKDL